MIYLDASAFMRMIEGDRTVRDHLQSLIREERYCTSIISITECLAKPIRESNLDAIQDYEDWFASSDLQLLWVNRSVAEIAARVRASFHLKTPDAIHFASRLLQRVRKS